MTPSRTPLSSGEALHALAGRLWSIPRSIAGPGTRETLRILAEQVPFTIHEIPTGTPILDWEAPREWELRGARLISPDGSVIADAAWQNLHVLNFGTGYRGRVPLADLRPHLFSDPTRPDRLPYRTSYWKEAWGFCLPHRVVETLPEGEYEVEIDAEHRDGSMSYAELVLPGELADEVLISTHCCHPQMANDNLSGLVVVSALAAELAARARRRLTWRFLLAPGTIGAIGWLATHREEAKRVRHGLVAAGLAGGGGFHYKRTRHGDAPIDHAVPRALARLGEALAVEPFLPFGYDERQYNSPGFAMAVGSLTRTPWGRYPEYHSDADDLGFVTAADLERSLDVYRAVVDELEGREVYRNLAPEGEPRLGKHGLYRSIGGDEAGRERELALLWVLNQSDGETDLATIGERSGLAEERLREAVDALVGAGLLERT